MTISRFTLNLKIQILFQKWPNLLGWVVACLLFVRCALRRPGKGAPCMSETAVRRLDHQAREAPKGRKGGPNITPKWPLDSTLEARWWPALGPRGPKRLSSKSGCWGPGGLWGSLGRLGALLARLWAVPGVFFGVLGALSGAAKQRARKRSRLETIFGRLWVHF